MRPSPLLTFAAQYLAGLGEDVHRIRTRQNVGTLLHGNRTFSIVANGDARYTQGSGFLLQTSTVRQNYHRVFPQIQEGHIRLGTNKRDLWSQFYAEFFKVALGARMNRENQRQLA